ncbi:MAG: LysM peptidoglycan-binding domain-containing protein [Flavobacterium sp.]|nr:LysM peptidoglycan-binding domain-containing protein [Flavobacterium sp.]
MKIKMLFFFVLCVFQFSLGQYKDQDVEIVNHEVQSNESVRALSKKYSVDPADIYKLNRFAVDGISEGMVLQIPVRKNESFSKQEAQSTNSLQEVGLVVDDAEEEKKIAIELEINKELENAFVENKAGTQHIVEANETIFGLSKKYNVTVEEIQAVNPGIQKEGLKVGKAIVIPTAKKTAKKEPSVSIVNSTKEFEIKEKVAEIIKHKVEPKETLYGLSKKYNVSVDEIKQKNEAVLQNGLQIGQILIIRKIN